MSDAQGETDIRAELQVALETKLDFSGSFSYKQDFPSAPNPSITIKDIGLVGLPLSQRDAAAIKSVAEQAPFGKGERTIVDKTVRDTWEIDAKLIEFENPTWKGFMAETVISACKVLGVNYQASQPRSELYKLLLYETGSHFLPHVDTEKADGMFATIIVVLPSKFTGGEAHLSHGGLSKVYDSSKDSVHQTTVMAWYTDVTHEIKPITSGYRLALAYNLVHTKQSLRPVLSSNNDFIDGVRNALISWNECEEDGIPTPEKLVYLLDHKYSQANLRAGALKGADDHKVSILAAVAEELGFNLGLASVEFHLSGAGDDDCHYRPQRWDCYSDEDSDDGYNDVNFGEVSDRDVSIETFVDLDGNHIANSLEFDNETETIPSDFVEDIESGPYDRQEYEGYMGNGAGSLDRWYRRTILVIWPECNDCEVRYAGSSFPLALRKVNTADVPLTERSNIVSYLLRSSKHDSPEVAKTVTQFASDTVDHELWNRCVKGHDASKSLTIFKGEDIFNAILILGLNNVKQTVESLLQGDSSNQRRYDTLEYLQEQIEESDESPEFKKTTGSWIEEQVDVFLRTLKRPEKGEQALYIQLAINHGGVEFFRDSVFPQLKEHAWGSFLLSLAVDFHQNQQLPECKAKKTVIQDIITIAISKVKFEAVKPKSQQATFLYPYSRPNAVTEAPGFAFAKAAVLACQSARCTDLVPLLLERLTRALKISDDACQRIELVVFPLLDFLRERKIVGEQTIPKLEKLLEVIINLYLTAPPSSVLSFTQPTVDALFRALSLQDNIKSLFFRIVLPKLSQVPSGSKGLEVVFRKLYDCRSQFHVPEGYSGITIRVVIDGLVQKYIASNAPYSTDRILQDLKAILHVRSHAATVAYFNTSIVTFRTQPAYQCVEFLLNSMRTLIDHYGAEALAPITRSLMRHWFNNVLGKRPDSDCTPALHSISQWVCSCNHCTRAKHFLQTQITKMIHMDRIGAPARKHLEQKLDTYAQLAATHVMVRTTPQGLTITKHQHFLVPQSWNATQTRGRTLLQGLSSTEKELKLLLGDTYDTITGVLRATKRKIAPHGSQHGTGPSALAAPRPAKKRRIVPGSSA
ncbi:hypothetical protein QCA50_000899 [Cerrena zonata]|uniref:Fe2OG dioxygenase domain-containing protein n=1 Tax=Cerrena zonata TaxID=2478898 RepID=A0AAW0GRW3_9APHY